MKIFEWDSGKNEFLIKNRGVSFEIVVALIQEGNVLDRVQHPNTKKYPGQHMFIIEIDGYVYAVPYVEDDTKFFLKTIIPSRKLTKKYLSE